MKAAKTPLILSQAARRLNVQSLFLENDLEGPLGGNAMHIKSLLMRQNASASHFNS